MDLHLLIRRCVSAACCVWFVRRARREKRPARKVSALAALALRLRLKSVSRSLPSGEVAVCVCLAPASLSVPCVRSPCAALSSRFCVLRVWSRPSIIRTLSIDLFASDCCVFRRVTDSRAASAARRARLCPSTNSASPAARWHSTWESCSPPGKHRNRYRTHVSSIRNYFHTSVNLCQICQWKCDETSYF